MENNGLTKLINSLQVTPNDLKYDQLGIYVYNQLDKYFYVYETNPLYMSEHSL